MNEQGVITKTINKVMGFLFGANWRTSLWGIVAILPQIVKPIQDYMAIHQFSEKALNTVSLVAAVIFAINSKDKQVTGTK